VALLFEKEALMRRNQKLPPLSAMKKWKLVASRKQYLYSLLFNMAAKIKASGETKRSYGAHGWYQKPRLKTKAAHIEAA